MDGLRLLYLTKKYLYLLLYFQDLFSEGKHPYCEINKNQLDKIACIHCSTYRYRINVIV